MTKNTSPSLSAVNNAFTDIRMSIFSKYVDKVELADVKIQCVLWTKLKSQLKKKKSIAMTWLRQEGRFHRIRHLP